MLVPHKNEIDFLSSRIASILGNKPTLVQTIANYLIGFIKDGKLKEYDDAVSKITTVRLSRPIALRSSTEFHLFDATPWNPPSNLNEEYLTTTFSGDYKIACSLSIIYSSSIQAKKVEFVFNVFLQHALSRLQIDLKNTKCHVLLIGTAKNTLQSNFSSNIRFPAVRIHTRGHKESPSILKGDNYDSPIDIISIISNLEFCPVSIEYTASKDMAYSFQILLATSKEPKDYLEEIKTNSVTTATKTKALITKTLTSDEDIALSSYKLSLTCPISQNRIECAAKAKYCKHIQCFDLSVLVSLFYNKQPNSYCCPICGTRISNYNDFVVDEYINTILSAVPKEITSVNIDVHGIWSIPEAEKLEIIDLTMDDDHDESKFDWSTVVVKKDPDQTRELKPSRPISIPHKPLRNDSFHQRFVPYDVPSTATTAAYPSITITPFPTLVHAPISQAFASNRQVAHRHRHRYPNSNYYTEDNFIVLMSSDEEPGQNFDDNHEEDDGEEDDENFEGEHFFTEDEGNTHHPWEPSYHGYRGPGPNHPFSLFNNYFNQVSAFYESQENNALIAANGASYKRVGNSNSAPHVGHHSNMSTNNGGRTAHHASPSSRLMKAIDTYTSKFSPLSNPTSSQDRNLSNPIHSSRGNSVEDAILLD